MQELLSQLPFWERLTDEEKLNLKMAACLRSFEAGSLLHGNCDGGGSCLGMVKVLKGELRVYILSEEGREITLFRLCQGDYCVFAASCILSKITFDTQIEAISDTELFVIPPHDFCKLSENNIYV